MDWPGSKSTASAEQQSTDFSLTAFSQAGAKHHNHVALEGVSERRGMHSGPFLPVRRIAPGMKTGDHDQGIIFDDKKQRVWEAV
jgi:hypothetical protein